MTYQKNFQKKFFSIKRIHKRIKNAGIIIEAIRFSIVKDGMHHKVDKKTENTEWVSQ